RAMRPWLHAYNTLRPHSALKGLPPISRITSDNVLSNDN
ncbi:IS481 family transposase, partial [Roseicella frigidaeris]